MSIADKPLRIREAAALLGVSRQTIWTWIRKGQMQGVRLPSGRYRVMNSEVLRILYEVKSI